MDLIISDDIKKAVPFLKIGLITYHDITVTDSPQLLKGRFQLLFEEWLLQNEEKAVSDIPGVNEWRGHFKAFGTDPSRYRPSHEALIRRLIKNRSIPSIHSAADINNYFSVVHEMPMGIYDLDKLEVDGPITLRIGELADTYTGINGREMSMDHKCLTSDDTGPFGSPIVDSQRSMVTQQTKNAIQIVYLGTSHTEAECEKILNMIGQTFVQFNGGDQHYAIYS